MSRGCGRPRRATAQRSSRRCFRARTSIPTAASPTSILRSLPTSGPIRSPRRARPSRASGSSGGSRATGSRCTRASCAPPKSDAASIAAGRLTTRHSHRRSTSVMPGSARSGTSTAIRCRRSATRTPTTAVASARISCSATATARAASPHSRSSSPCASRRWAIASRSTIRTKVSRSSAATAARSNAGTACRSRSSARCTWTSRRSSRTTATHGSPRISSALSQRSPITLQGKRCVER